MSATLLSRPGLTITRDEHGVPHIEAGSERDLYRGLGFVHGHDRGLQVLLTRMAGYGRLAERLPGAALLEADRGFRRLGFHLGADEQVEALTPDARDIVQAYCGGMNQALRGRPPWELRLFGIRRVDPWVPQDCMVLARLIGYVGLGQSQGEMERLIVQLVRNGLPREHLEEMFPRGLDGLDEQLLADVEPGEPLVPPAVRWTPFVPRPIASNNWVVSGSRTRSGRPVLSGDPHLELHLPAIWDEVVGRWDDRWVVAATMPGVPGFLMARTDSLGWTATYAFMDATDAWVEQCRDGRVRRDVDGQETWVPVSTRTERIAVRGKDDVELVVHETDRGVLDGPPDGEARRLATRWSGSGGGAESMEAVIAMLRARDVDAGRDAIGRLEMAFNWVIADAAGSIGYQMSGLLPRRARPDSGLVPLPAWDPGTAWQGFTAVADLPRDKDPECGYIVTANNDLNHLGVATPIDLPMGSSRADRIAEVLAGNDSWTVDDTRRLQVDLVSHHAAGYLEVLRPLLGDSPNERVLREWDCRYDVDSVGATLFERWYRALVVDVVGGAVGDAVMAFVLDETGVLADFYDNVDNVLRREGSAWFRGRTREQVYAAAAATALPGAAEPWGELRQITAKHLLFGGTPLARLGYDRGPFALPGGRGTVQQGQLYRAAGVDTSFLPTFRLVTDFADDVVHTALAGGPSDRVRSRWYASDFEGWRAGRLKQLRP